jgi:hypothetical protein
LSFSVRLGMGMRENQGCNCSQARPAGPVSLQALEVRVGRRLIRRPAADKAIAGA